MDEKNKEKDTVAIFHLYRKDGSALFLHPFNDLERFLEILKTSEIEGKYGKEPRVESFTLFRNDLYHMIDAAVRHWVAETHFFPRLLIAAGVFLASYLALAFAFHDPLPMPDELALGVALAAGTYFLLARLESRSDFVVKKTQAMRERIDKIYFQEDPFALEVEQALERSESESPEQILRAIQGLSDVPFNIENEREAMQLTSYLERRFSDRDLRRQERLLATADASNASRVVESLAKWAESKKVDLSLFVLYRRMKHSHKPVK